VKKLKSHQKKQEITLLTLLVIIILILFLIKNCGYRPTFSPSGTDAIHPSHTPTPAPNPVPENLPSRTLFHSSSHSLGHTLGHSLGSPLNEPHYTVTLNAADSRLFYNHFFEDHFELSDSARAMALHCSPPERGIDPSCSFHFNIARNNDSIHMRYNSTNGMIQLTFHSAADTDLFKNFLVSSSTGLASLQTQEELVIPTPTGKSAVVPRVLVDCQSDPDTCSVVAYRDFHSLGDTR